MGLNNMELKFGDRESIRWRNLQREFLEKVDEAEEKEKQKGDNEKQLKLNLLFNEGGLKRRNKWQKQKEIIVR